MKNLIPSTGQGFFGLISLLFFGFLIGMVACEVGPPEGSKANQANRGMAIFNEQCISCHGYKDVAPTQPEQNAPDLTKIMKRRNRSTFPIAEMARVIDGRKEVAAHGPRSMPVWGEVYEAEGMDTEEIRGRKGELVAFLMSIQSNL
ncbi:MAG: cytochrome c [Saprospiraceae bacterium]|nr:cytochrome c [Saprospiraceae bacterium]